MRTEVLDFLKSHQSKTPSSFVEDAQWRQENAEWLAWSRQVALKLIDYMQENNLTRSDIADKLGVSHQYVSKILSGLQNFSFKTIAEIQQKLNIQLFSF